MGVGRKRHALTAVPPGKDLVLIMQKSGWVSGTIWTLRKNLAPPGFDPRTFQPVASR